MLLLFVDDTLTVAHKDALPAFIQEFKKDWEIRDYGEPKVFLGCDIVRDRSAGTIKLFQETYIENIGKRAGVGRTVPIYTPFEPNQVLTAKNSENSDIMMCRLMDPNIDP